MKLVNRNQYQTLAITSLQYEDENFPSKSWHNLKPPVLEVEKEAIQAVTDLFEKRPIWSRYGITCSLDPKYHKVIKKALPHVAYTFQSGAWRDTWVRYGLDPRKDPKCYM